MSNCNLFFTDLYQLGVPHIIKVSTKALRSNIEVKRSKRSEKFVCQKFMSEHQSKGIFRISDINVELYACKRRNIIFRQTSDSKLYSGVELRP